MDSRHTVGVSSCCSGLLPRKGLTAFVCLEKCAEFLLLVIQEFRDVFSRRFMRQDSKGKIMRGKMVF